MFNDIPTFAISLKRSSKRREYIKNHLKSKNIQYSLVDAVDGKTLTKKQIAAIVTNKKKTKKNKKNHKLNPAGIGCALSHIKIYKRMIDENLPYALILEDDALVEDGFDADFLKAIPLNWDVLFLGYHIDNTEPVPPIPCSFWNRYKKDNFTIAKPVIGVAGTHGYILSQQGAKKLLHQTNSLEKPIDAYTSNIRLLNVFIFKKKPIIRVNYLTYNFTIFPKKSGTPSFQRKLQKKDSYSSPKISFARKMARKYLNAFRLLKRKIFN